MDLERGFKLIKFICSVSENTFQKCHAPPPPQTNENIHLSLHIRENFLDPPGILNVYYG